MEKIKVIIDTDGQVAVETKGFKGRGCMAASQFLEKALGTTITTKKTSEYYEDAFQEKVKINHAK